MDNIEVWAIGIAALAVLAFVFQVISVILTARSVQKVTSQIESQSQQLESTLSRVQTHLLEISESLEPVRGVVEALADNLSKVSETLQKRTEHADAVIKEVMTVGQDQAAKINYLVSDTLGKFEETTETIQKDLLKPAIEIASFIRGIRSGIDALFSRRRGVKKKSEEELFI